MDLVEADPVGCKFRFILIVKVQARDVKHLIVPLRLPIVIQMLYDPHIDCPTQGSGLMRQEFLLFAERAEAVGPKIFIHGGAVDRHFVPPNAPTPIQLMGDIAVGILTEWAETNRGHVMAIRIVDEDEKVIWAMEGQMEVGRPPGAKPGQHFRQLLTVRGPFGVPDRGAYKIILELDGAPQEPPFRLWVEDLAS